MKNCMENKMKEEWRPIRGFEEYAEASNLGQIHYFAGKSRKYPDDRWTYGNETSDGYLQASIGGVNKGVHIWVYLTFVGDIPEGVEVNHIDEDKHNNCVWNLNLMTRSQNVNWGMRNARVAAALTNNTKTSKAVQALDKNGNVVYEFPSLMEAQRQGFKASAVSECCRNCYSLHKGNNYKGYIWQYKDFSLV